MRYVTHYTEYPIYEPAEGGCYYSGNKVVNRERLSKRKAKAEIEKLWQQCLTENEDVMEYYDHDEEKYWGRVWRRKENYIWRDYDPYDTHRYIGTGESFCIERKCGSHESGWQPYC